MSQNINQTKFEPEKIMKRVNSEELPLPIQIYSKQLVTDRPFQEKIKKLSILKPWRSTLALAGDWIVMISAISIAITIPHILTWLGAIVVVGVRQHALLVLAHDAVHYRLFKNHSVNDGVCDLFIGFPLLASVRHLRRDHLAHHFYLFSEKDTEIRRRKGRPGWDFPTTRLKLFGHLIADILGRSFIPFLKFLLMPAPKGADLPGKPEPANWTFHAVRIGYYIGLTGALTYFKIWIPFLVLWLLPAFTVLPSVFRMRNIGRHFGIPRTHDLNMARNTLHPPLWEKFFIAPHNVGYHLDHHIYPSVPYYNLPALHKALADIPSYKESAYHSNSYFGWKEKSVLVDVTTPKATAKSMPEDITTEEFI